MFKKNKIILSFLAVFLFTSCYNYRNTGLLQDARRVLPQYDSVEYKDYHIRVNDEIMYRLITSDETISRIISPNAASASTNMLSYRVSPEGTIDLPFIKDIHVEGLTLLEATEVVEKRFKEIIPDATVKLTLQNKTFTMIGDVASGVYPIYRERMTIYQALALGRDILQTGDRKHVRIIRETNDGTQVLEFDIRPKSVIDSEYYYVYPNDIIYVRKAPASFYKVANYSSFLSLIMSSLTLLTTVLLYARMAK